MIRNTYELNMYVSGTAEILQCNDKLHQDIQSLLLALNIGRQVNNRSQEVELKNKKVFKYYFLAVNHCLPIGISFCF